MWKTALENAKLIASTIMVISALLAGSWTIITSTFITKAEANDLYRQLDMDTSYNKAFRIESMILRIESIRTTRTLTIDEEKMLNRLKKDIERVDEHIYYIDF